VILLIVVILVAFFAFQFRTGKVVTIFPEEFNVGDKFEAGLLIKIEKGDSIHESAPVVITIEKRDVELVTNVIKFEEFIKNSDNPIKPVRVRGRLYYETPGSYLVNLNELLDYEFTESGEYELSFRMISEGLDVRKTFEVE